MIINPLNAEINSICHLLVLLGAHPILQISRIRVNIQYYEPMYPTTQALHKKLSYCTLTVYSFVSFATCALTGAKLRSPGLRVRNQTHKTHKYPTLKYLHLFITNISVHLDCRRR